MFKHALETNFGKSGVLLAKGDRRGVESPRTGGLTFDVAAGAGRLG